MQSFDVVISGGGMVGLSLACGLQGSGLRVAVIEQQTPSLMPFESPSNSADPHLASAQDSAQSLMSNYSTRVSAINMASETLLGRIGVWQDILSRRANPYDAMAVWEQDSFASIDFHAQDYGVQHLGHIIENDVIQQALWQQAAEQSSITLLAPATLQQVVWGENEAFISLQDGRMLSARLVVAADGAHSWLRQRADIPLTFWDYRHHALVATIRTELPHQNTAWQVFRNSASGVFPQNLFPHKWFSEHSFSNEPSNNDSILAFLPLQDPHLSSIVWSLPPLEAERIAQLSTEQFNRELAVAFDMKLGLCQLESQRQVFPLVGRYARNFAAHRLVLVGDTAHTIHPLAGQGVNLGFMDVALLIDELERLQQQGKDIGQHLYLRRYERQRKYQAALMLGAMQGLRELFAGNSPAKKLLRDIGMVMADKLPGVKPLLVRQALGLEQLPESGQYQ